MRTSLAALAAGLLLAFAVPAAASASTDPLSGYAAGALDRHELPGPAAFPEGLAAAPDGSFYTGSLIDGTLFKGDVRDVAASVLSPAGADGRTSVAGMEVDSRGRLWVAGASTGLLWVYDTRTGILLHRFVLGTPGSGTVNDVAVAPDGAVYVTDSSTPRLWRVPLRDADAPGTTAVAPWLDLTGSVPYRTGDGTDGVNLNGLAPTADGRALLVVQTNSGALWRIGLRRGEVSRVPVAGGPLTYGDGLIADGRRVVVVRNVLGQVVRLRADRDGRAARVIGAVTSSAFAFPTAVAMTRGRLLVANSQLPAAPVAASLPFTISDLPAVALQRARP